MASCKWSTVFSTGVERSGSSISRRERHAAQPWMHGASVAAVLSAVACALVAAALAADWTTRPPAGFAGVWILDHDLGAPGVSAMDADQVHTVLGMRVVIA